MHKNPSNLNQVRDNLAEAAHTAWVDKSFVPRAIVMVNAMGKIINSVAVELKAAEMAKIAPDSSMLPPPKSSPDLGMAMGIIADKRASGENPGALS